MYFIIQCVVVVVLLCELAFQSVSGTIYAINVSESEIILDGELGCAAACMDTNSSAPFPICFKGCKTSNQTVTKISSNESLRLICREADTLVIEISSGDQQQKGVLFVLKLRDNVSSESIYVTNSTIARITKLQPNTSYTIEASVYTANFKYRHIPSTASFKTLETFDYVPDTILNESIKIRYAAADDGESELVTTIEWAPTTAMTCSYYIHMYATREEDFITPFEQNIRKIQVYELYRLRITHLSFKTEYFMEIHGANAKFSFIEGRRSGIEFVTPTCWEIYGHNLERCAPPPVTNIESTHELVENNTYRVDVTWDQPEKSPDYYDVALNMFPSHGNIHSQTVNGSQNWISFPAVHLTGSSYNVTIIAYSKGGYTHSLDAQFELRPLFPDKYVIYYISFIGALMALISAGIAIRWRQSRRKQMDGIFAEEMQLRKIVHKYKSDPMEIDPANLDMRELIGEGAFGIVQKAILKNKNQVVAVKTIKKNCEDIKCLVREIILMKSLGRHENLVEIVGHSTTIPGNLMLLTEYCSEGNLLEYLRRFRKIRYEGRTVNPSVKSVPYAISNLMYMKLEKQHERARANVYFDGNRLSKSQSNITNDAPNSKEYSNVPSSDTLYAVDPVSFASNRGYGMLALSQDSGLHQPSYYDLHSAHRQSDNLLNDRDLLSFAKQIAIGMDFLASNKIVHRDLAARNILVCENKTVKIADFGLSRNIFVDNIYTKTTSGRLPIKWLALESITEREYTTQSDVWSYGVLLNEIVTLGSEPYPNISAVDEIVTYLQAGNRMQKPANCSQDFYDLISSCWNSDKYLRPSFSDILTKLDWFIHQSETIEIIGMGESEKCELTHDCSTSYLQLY